MELYPAVDIEGGRVARSTSASDPIAAVRQFARDGARWVHVVDLDRAFGKGENRELTRRLLAEAAVRIQVGGGVTSDDGVAELVGWGATRVVIGTAGAVDAVLVARLLGRYGAERLAVLSQHERPICVKKDGLKRKSTGAEDKRKVDWMAFDAITDEDIATSIRDDPDVAPELDADWFASATLVMPKPKEQISIRLDRDVLEHFRRGQRHCCLFVEGRNQRLLLADRAARVVEWVRFHRARSRR